MRFYRSLGLGAVGLYLALFSFFSYGAVKTLSERMEMELNFPGSGLTSQLKNELAAKHVVFVDGIMNELADIAHVYFKDNIGQIEKLGMTYSHLGFSSMKSIQDNAEELLDEIEKISDSVGKPIILIGHSMGGGEALDLVLNNPVLFASKRIDRVVSIQGAIGGSILAENFSENFIASRMSNRIEGGIKSLRPVVAQSNFRSAFISFQEKLLKDSDGQGGDAVKAQYDSLSQKFYFVRSARHTNGRKLSLGLELVLLWFKKGIMNDTENDGLLPVDNQILGIQPVVPVFSPFGIDLGILEGDHLDFVIAGIFSSSDREHRVAFTNALLESIYENPAEMIRVSGERSYWKMDSTETAFQQSRGIVH